MTIADWIEDGKDVSELIGVQVQIQLREKMRIGRFEGVQENKATVRYNGRQENSWNLPYNVNTNEVHIVFRDGSLVPYDARPLTQR